jgi:enamine deaminase RidA (YjgF/YER057c/UK114 family)
MKLVLALVVLAPLTAWAAAAAPVAPAASQITRQGGAFPISSIVVVENVGGADIAYASGATALSPAPGTPVTGDTKAQTIGALTRLAETLKSQGFALGDIVMMRIYLVADGASGKMDFAGMMAGYTQFFGTPAQPNKPARTTVQVAGLAAPGALVEIEAQAVRSSR